jgi:hypothetical protein
MDIKGNRTYATCITQMITGGVGIACYLKPDLVGIFTSLGLAVLTPDQALLMLYLGLTQVFAGLKSIFSRLAISDVKKEVEVINDNSCPTR